MSFLSRREFIKLSALAVGSLSGLAFNPFPLPLDDRDYPSEWIGRVTVSNKITVYSEPNWNSAVVGYLNFKDTLFHIYYEVTSPEGPAYNPFWYRVFGGYIHSAYVQKVHFRFNKALSAIPEAGQLCEVTVPFTQVHKFNDYQNKWERFFRLYFETTHWVVGIDQGPDDEAWYRINDNGIEYLVPATHLHPIPDAEWTPLSPEVPWAEKRIEVSIREQTLYAYEGKDVVFQARVSTGMNVRPDPDELPWNTPRGRYNIASKTPSTHMGQGNLTGDPEAYELPGVPWTMYFIPEIGVAFHGAYWHNNFGLQMSHGCVNMRPHEARWLFRWCYPIFEVPPKDRSGWEKSGYGTPVLVY